MFHKILKSDKQNPYGKPTVCIDFHSSTIMSQLLLTNSIKCRYLIRLRKVYSTFQTGATFKFVCFPLGGVFPRNMCMLLE